VDPYPQYVTDADLANPASGPSVALRAAFGSVIYAKAPGANVLGDAVELAARLAEVPATGARLVLQPGTYSVPNGGLSCANPVAIMGAGGGTYEGGGTRIACSSATATLLTLSAPGWSMTDVALVNTSGTRPTAGAGLLATDGDWTRITRCLFVGFWNGIQYDAGYYYSITDTAVINPRNYGMWLRNTTSNQFDHGDQVIHGCTITKYGDTIAGGTAVRWESGGGLRFTTNKINGGSQPGYTSTARFASGLDIAVADGPSSGTSVFTIVGNSIENCTVAFVSVTQAGPSNTSSLAKLIIADNEIGIGGGVGIAISPATTGKISDVLIEGNYIGYVSTCIRAANTDGLTIGTNRLTQWASNGYPVDIQAGCTNYLVTRQNTAYLDNVNLYRDNNTSSSVRAEMVQATQTYDREIPATTSTSTYSYLWNLTVPTNTGVLIRVRLTGNVGGKGTIVKEFSRFLSRGTGAVTVTGAGADIDLGAVLDIDFDAVTTSGNVGIRVKLNTTAGGTDIIGRASLQIEGPIFLVRRGL
jgi:hypothetical protein